MAKKKYFIGLFTSLLVLGLGLSSICFADTTREKIKLDLQKLGAGGVVGSQIYQTIVLDASMDNYSNYFILVGQGQRSESVSSRVYRMSTNRMLYICAFSASTITNYSNSTSNVSYFSWNYGNGEGAMYNYTSGVRSSTGSFSYNDCIEPYYLYTTAPINTRLITLGAGEEHGGNYIVPSVAWEYVAGGVNTSVEGFESSFKGYTYDYSLRNWTLGYIDGIENFQRYRFDLYQIYSTTDQQVVASEELFKTSSETFRFQGNNFSYNNGNGLISITSRLLYYQPYYLIIYYYNNNGEIENSIDAYFIFRPIGSTIPAIIGSGDMVSSGDYYNQQNSTNDIIDTFTNTDEATGTIDNFFSGDASSFANNLGFSPISNPFVQIISNTLQSIIDIVLGSGNETLTLGVHDNAIVLHSEDFVIPNGLIRTFVTLVTNGFLIWAIIKYGFQLYQWINTGRLQNLVNEANGHWYKTLF